MIDDLPLNPAQRQWSAELDKGFAALPAIRPSMHGGLRRWVLWGIPPGEFMRAVLRNDLREAVGRADELNLSALHDWCRLLYGFAPSDCHGSAETVATWAAFDGLANLEQRAQLHALRAA